MNVIQKLLRSIVPMELLNAKQITLFVTVLDTCLHKPAIKHVHMYINVTNSKEKDVLFNRKTGITST